VQNALLPRDALEKMRLSTVEPTMDAQVAMHMGHTNVHYPGLNSGPVPGLGAGKRHDIRCYHYKKGGHMMKECWQYKKKQNISQAGKRKH
jgi:hypothetical protein